MDPGSGYRVIFDATEIGFRTFQIPVLGLVIGAIIAFALMVSADRSRRFALVPVYMTLFLTTLWVFASFTAAYSEYRENGLAVRNHEALVVQGIVTGFSPAPYAGHEDERFCVESTCFALQTT